MIKIEDLKNHPDHLLTYHVEGRNGYYGVDEYLNKAGDATSGCTSTVDIFKTRKQAVTVCNHMNMLPNEINKLRGSHANH